MKFILWTIVWFGLYEIDCLVTILELEHLDMHITYLTNFIVAWVFIALWLPIYIRFIK